jgi:hypothetical protein
VQASDVVGQPLPESLGWLDIDVTPFHGAAPFLEWAGAQSAFSSPMDATSRAVMTNPIMNLRDVRAEGYAICREPRETLVLLQQFPVRRDDLDRIWRLRDDVDPTWSRECVCRCDATSQRTSNRVREGSSALRWTTKG